MPLEYFDPHRDIRNLFITPEIRNRIMQVQPGETTQGHTHDLGHETFIVLEGEAEFTIDKESAVLRSGQVCVAAAGQWHTIRCIGNSPMTMYLSVTPHLEPTHTQWDREGGNRLPYRFGDATRFERNARSEPPEPIEPLLERYVAASAELATAAQANAAAQTAAVANLRAALQSDDKAAAYAAVDTMWRSFYAMYTRLQATELAWNQVATLAAPE
jgi:quercetin dioxygenase-like cupin family protein